VAQGIAPEFKPQYHKKKKKKKNFTKASGGGDVISGPRFTWWFVVILRINFSASKVVYWGIGLSKNTNMGSFSLFIIFISSYYFHMHLLLSICLF
jgi:hypothetical protein